MGKINTVHKSPLYQFKQMEGNKNQIFQWCLSAVKRLVRYTCHLRY